MTIKNTTQAIIEFLKKNDYCVNVYVENDDVLVDIPQRIVFPEIAKSCIKYKFCDDGISISVDATGYGIINSTLKEMPQYARRPYVINHIFKNCLIIQYNFSLINWLDNNGNYVKSGDFYMLMPSPPPEQLQQEGDLNVIITSGITNGFNNQLDEIAHQQNIYDGFVLIRDTLQSTNVL